MELWLKLECNRKDLIFNRTRTICILHSDRNKSNEI